MTEEILKNINNWGKKPFDKKTIQELNILKKNESELHDSFYKNLEFGTGGMRGIMGVGTNRINKYTLIPFAENTSATIFASMLLFFLQSNAITTFFEIFC